MSGGSGRSPWFYAAIGCVVLIVAALAAAGMLIYLGAGVARGVRRQLAEPVSRAAQARGMLGAQQLPAGYEAELAISVPLLGEVVILRQRDADQGAVFIYGKLRDGAAPGGLDLSTSGGLARLLELGGYEIERSEQIGSGALSVGSQQIAYTIHRGQLKGSSSVADRIFIPLEVSCNGEQSGRRLGLWLGQLERVNAFENPEPLRALFSGINVCAG